MYTTIIGGDAAIEASHVLVERERRGDPSVGELSIDQISNQLSLAVDRVMAEGSLYDRELASLAVKQAQGDTVEATLLLRAYRTTLERFGYSEPATTEEMVTRRRVCTTHRDVPGGQVLGSTYDYVHRLLDFELLAEREIASLPEGEEMPASVLEQLNQSIDSIIEPALVEPNTAADGPVADISRQPLIMPSRQDQRLQSLARADEGFLLALAYSARGTGRNQPYITELKVGEVEIEFVLPELGTAVTIGEITLTEARTIYQFGNVPDREPRFTRGYGLSFGNNERKAISMAVIERALRSKDLDEATNYPAQDEEFVLFHCDSIESSGWVQHLKLPHYVDFQADLQLTKRLHKEFLAQGDGTTEMSSVQHSRDKADVEDEEE